MAKSQVSFDVVLTSGTGVPLSFVRTNLTMKEALAVSGQENESERNKQDGLVAVVVIHGSINDADIEPAVRYEKDLAEEFKTCVWSNYAKLPTLALQASVIGHCNMVKEAALDGLIETPYDLGFVARSFELLYETIVPTEDACNDFVLAQSGDIRNTELEEFLGEHLGGGLFERAAQAKPEPVAVKPTKATKKKPAKKSA